MKRRGLLRGLLGGGAAAAVTAIAPPAPSPVVVEKIVEKPVEVIKEVTKIVQVQPRRLTHQQIKAFIAGPCSKKSLDDLAKDAPVVMKIDKDEYVTWNGIGFYVPPGEHLLPGPIAYVLSMSRQDDLDGQVELLYGMFGKRRNVG